MSICILTNYLDKNFIDEQKIILRSSILLNADIYNFNDENLHFKINKKYDNVLVYFNFKVTNLKKYKDVLQRIKIKKTFVIDTIPHIEKDVHKDILKYIENGKIHYTLSEKNNLSLLYNLGDNFIFYDHIDYNFYSTYNLKNKNTLLVLPSLQEENNFIVNKENLLSSCNSICYNNNLYYKSGIFDGLNLIKNEKFYFNIFGSHGRDDINEENLINYYTDNYKNIKFKGKLINKDKFYKYNLIYYGASNYDYFNYEYYTSIFKGLVPIVKENSLFAKIIKDYKFTIKEDYSNINSVIIDLFNYNKEELYTIMQNYSNVLKKYDDNYFVSTVKGFLNG